MLEHVEATNEKSGLLRFGLREKYPICFHEHNITDMHMEVEVTPAKPEQEICTVEFAFSTSDTCSQFLQNIVTGLWTASKHNLICQDG